jgi:hypothetical protein
MVKHVTSSTLIGTISLASMAEGVSSAIRERIEGEACSLSLDFNHPVEDTIREN